MAEAFLLKDHYDIRDLLTIMRILRSEEGCPWDREQTHESIRRDFIEEAYEAIEAIDLGDVVLLKEELGDVLLQVVFHSRMEEEAGRFTFEDVVDGICKKLVIRHPHVFSDGDARTSDEVLDRWEKIKQAGKGQTTVTETLESVAKSLPGLMYAQKVQKRAEKGGCLVSPEETVDALFTDLQVLKAGFAAHTSGEEAAVLGKMLFTLAALCRKRGVDAEECLSAATARFIGAYGEAERTGKGTEDLLALLR